MKKNTQTERHDCQITPFTFGNHAVRTAVIDGSPWFAAKNVCEVLGIANHRNAINGFPADEKGLVSTDAPDGRQYLITVSEPGLYRLIFTARKKRANGFKTGCLRR
jgi:prophage antirepressor-like protein